MAKENMTIEEVKKAKIELESNILELLKTFEDKTGVYISYIHTERKRKKVKRSSDYDEISPYSESKGPLTNIDISMDLDLIY